MAGEQLWWCQQKLDEVKLLQLLQRKDNSWIKIIKPYYYGNILATEFNAFGWNYHGDNTWLYMDSLIKDMKCTPGSWGQEFCHPIEQFSSVCARHSLKSRSNWGGSTGSIGQEIIVFFF